MRLLPYPRSFAGLLLAGFALAALPLLLGLGYTAYAQQRLAAQTRGAIELTARITRTTRQLAEDVSTLQRSAGQYYVLQDSQLRAGMDAAHQALRLREQALRGMPFAPADGARVAEFAQREDALYGQLSDPGALGLRRFDDFGPQFARLGTLAAQIGDSGSVLVARQIEALSERADALHVALLIQAAAAVLVSILVAGLFSWLLARPVRQIDQAIRRLGAGDLRTAAQVRGPGDLVALGSQLDWLRQRLREVEEQKLRFLAHVSHELKTPLASLREGVELLADGVGGRLGAQQQEIIQIMRGNARDLQQRIENLIGYSRAQRQLDPLLTGGVDLDELLEDIVRRNDLRLRAKSLGVARSGHAPPLEADRGKLDALFENLFINAMRFSPAGGVIGVAIDTVDGAVEVRISDQGPGVAEADRALLFQPFFQGSRQPPGAAPGSGLGLAIAQEYAQLHGGEIRLLDTGPGACFAVRLPLRREAGA